MPPNPEEAKAPLESIRLVQEVATRSMSRTPSPSSPLPPSYLPLLQITPYVKEPPDWESPTGVKVTDIVAHFELLNKNKDRHDEGSGSNSSRNESRSSGIFSDFDEDHTDHQSWSNISRSSTPLRNSSGCGDRTTPTTTPTPIPHPRTLSFANCSADSFGEKPEKEKDGEFLSEIGNVGEIEKSEIIPEEDVDDDASPEPEVEVNYVLEEVNNNDFDQDHTHQYHNFSADAETEAKSFSSRNFVQKLIRKSFSFSIFLYLVATGSAGAFLLGLQTSPKYLDFLTSLQAQSQQEIATILRNILPTLQRLLDLTPNFLTNEGLPLLLVVVIMFKFLGWYFIFRKYLWRSKSNVSPSPGTLSGLLTNCLLILFQPGLFLIAEPASSNYENDTVNDEDDLGQGHGDDAYSAKFQFEDSGFLEEIDDANPTSDPFSFDASIISDKVMNHDLSDPRQSGSHTLLLLTFWLSLLQIASIGVGGLCLTPNYLGWEKLPLLESFLIFGQLPQFAIFLLVWPSRAIFSIIGKRHKRRKMD